MKSKLRATNNKEQSADDPSVDLIRVKNMLNSTISMSYPDVVIACIEHKVSLEAFPEQLRQRWWSTIIIWRIIPCGWLITITANHSNYLVCDRANTQSVTVRKGNPPITAMPVIKWIYNIVLFGGKNAGCSFFITLIDVYAFFSDVGLRRQASMTQAEKFLTLFAQERC